MEHEPQTSEYMGQIYKLKRSASLQPEALLVMIHGWTGSETSTWVLTSGLTDKFTILAPRGPINASGSGFGWADITLPSEELWKDYEASTHSLHSWLTDYRESIQIKDIPVQLVGFSQGAAVAYNLMLFYPGKYRLAACLAGAMAPQAEQYVSPERVKGAKFYIAHGTRDKIITVDRARRAVQLLQHAGADVMYCESDIGHKASPECYANLISFLNSSLD